MKKMSLEQLVDVLKDGITVLYPKSLPKNIADCADKLYEVTRARIHLNREIALLAELETGLEEKIINELPKENASGISGRIANVKIIPFSVSQVDVENGGWEKVWGWIKKQRGVEGFAILNKAINRKSIEELQEGKKVIPGLKRFNGKKVSCTRI